MMDLFQIFMVGLIFSFLGSIPPGTINLSVMQLGLKKQMQGALLFTLAAVLVEFVYASMAVKFQMFLTTNTSLTENFQILSALAMLVLGIFNLSRKGIQDSKPKPGVDSFKKGILISLANPLAIPFWLAVTAYLQNHQMIHITGNATFFSYILGICAGTFLLLMLVANLATRASQLFQNNFVVYRLPGLIFLGMGLYTFWG